MLYCYSRFDPRHCHPMRRPCHLPYTRHSAASHMPHLSPFRSPVLPGHAWVFSGVRHRHGQVDDSRPYPCGLIL